MPAERFVDQLNTQIGHEFAAHQQYVACAVYYDALTMPQMAGFFYAQALEERDHAMMMVKYLIDSDAPVGSRGRRAAGGVRRLGRARGAGPRTGEAGQRPRSTS